MDEIENPTSMGILASSSCEWAVMQGMNERFFCSLWRRVTSRACQGPTALKVTFAFATCFHVWLGHSFFFNPCILQNQCYCYRQVMHRTNTL